MTTNQQIAKRGRKASVITWPSGQFTTAMVQQAHPKISKVSVQLRINKAIAKGELVKTGIIKNKIGRPSVQYTIKVS